MFVQVKPPQPVLMIDRAERVDEKLPDLWPRLETHRKKQVASCWADLIQRALPRRAERPGGECGTDR